jgi:hypothetical protein
MVRVPCPVDGMQVRPYGELQTLGAGY